MSKIFAPSEMLNDSNFSKTSSSCLTINNDYSYTYVNTIESGGYCTYVVYPKYDYMYRKTCSTRNYASTCNGFSGTEFTFSSNTEYRQDFFYIVLLSIALVFVAWFFIAKVVRGTFLGWRWS